MAVNLGFKIFTTVRTDPDLQFQSAVIFFHIVVKQPMLDGLDGLCVRVFPLKFPRIAADVADTPIRIGLVRLINPFYFK